MVGKFARAPLPTISAATDEFAHPTARYGTWVGQAAVDPDVVWAKFAALAEGARLASKKFWQ